MIKNHQVVAKLDPFQSMSIEERQEFLSVFPSLLEGWLVGNAMGLAFKTEVAHKEESDFAIKWGHGAYKNFVKWMVYFSKILPHKQQQLYRLISIPKTDKTRLKIKAGKNVLHSWTTDIEAARFLYKLAYKGRYKDNDKWSYLIVSMDMKASRQGINYAQMLKLTQWVLKNVEGLHQQAQLDPKSLYSVKNIRLAWTALLKRLSVKLIREQHEVICIGSEPFVVTVVERM